MYGNMLSQGFELMLYGLIGVFSTLALFYVAIKVLVKIFPEKK